MAANTPLKPDQSLLSAFVEDFFHGANQLEIFPLPQSHGQTMLLGQIRDRLDQEIGQIKNIETAVSNNTETSKALAQPIVETLQAHRSGSAIKPDDIRHILANSNTQLNTQLNGINKELTDISTHTEKSSSLLMSANYELQDVNRSLENVIDQQLISNNYLMDMVGQNMTAIGQRSKLIDQNVVGIEQRETLIRHTHNAVQQMEQISQIGKISAIQGSHMLAQGNAGIAQRDNQIQLMEQLIEATLVNEKNKILMHNDLKETILNSVQDVLIFFNRSLAEMRQAITDQIQHLKKSVDDISTEIQRHNRESLKDDAEQFKATAREWLFDRHYAAADTDFRKALEKNSRDYEANTGAAICAFGQNKLKEAEDYFEKARYCTNIEKETVFVTINLSKTKYHNGKLSDSIDLLEKLFKKYPDNTEVKFSLCEYLLEDNQNERAKEMLREVVIDNHAYFYRLRDSVLIKKHIALQKDIIMPIIGDKKGSSVLYIIFAVTFYAFGDKNLMEQCLSFAIKNNIHLILHVDTFTKSLFYSHMDYLKNEIEEIWQDEKAKLNPENCYSLALLYHTVYTNDKNMQSAFLKTGWDKDKKVETFLQKKDTDGLLNYFESLFHESTEFLSILCAFRWVPKDVRENILNR